MVAALRKYKKWEVLVNTVGKTGGILYRSSVRGPWCASCYVGQMLKDKTVFDVHEK